MCRGQARLGEVRIVRPVAALLLAVALLCVAVATGAEAQSGGGAPAPAAATVTPIRTDSPRATFESFQRLGDEMEVALSDYLAAPTRAGVSRLALLSDQMNGLIYLGGQASAARREVGIRTMTYLMDIFGRLPPIDPAAIPDADGMEAEGLTSVRVPGTPIYIARPSEADHGGEYLFVGSTVATAPRFFRAVEGLPLRTRLPIDSFSGLGPQLTGPMIPPRIVAAMPAALRTLWLGTPAWKVLTTLGVVALMAALAVGLQRATGRLDPRSRMGALLLRALLPFAILLLATRVLSGFTMQLNLSGRFADAVSATGTMIAYAASAWLFWLALRLLFEAVILSPRIPDASLDANLLRLVSNVLGIVGTVVILAFGGQAIGLPILSILAGLGIGGLAIALALRPTLENLVGGVILYLDRPVRVGDFCEFGDQMGTIEAIGARSTKLRALDRTLIAVPNAQFADMQIVNYAYCDRMLLHTVVGVRHETTPDQLRYLLAKMRAMLHAHPRVEGETVRVRLAGFGPSSLDIDLRVYVETREWNDFFAIREDILLRTVALVAEAGTELAYPTQTLHLARDGGLDTDRSENAETVVGEWRRQGRLPFPRYAAADIAALEGTLDYPPRGSVGAEAAPPSDEPLSHGEDGTGEAAPAGTHEPLSTQERPR